MIAINPASAAKGMYLNTAQKQRNSPNNQRSAARVTNMGIYWSKVAARSAAAICSSSNTEFRSIWIARNLVDPRSTRLFPPSPSKITSVL